jgi:sialidase-1
MAKDGSLVATADERFFTGGDNPNRIDKVVRVSHDGGITWGKQVTAVATLGKDKMHSSAAIDPATLYDNETDTIFMLYSFTPAGIGILNCNKGSGLKDGKQIVTKGICKYIVENGELTHRGKAIGIQVDEQGNLSVGGNIFTDSSPYKAYGTSYLMLTKSTDGGNTWSKPVCLDKMVKGKRMHFIGSGPANGIKIKNGKYAGRLIFPVYYGLNKLPMSLTCAVIWSDDGGETWDSDHVLYINEATSDLGYPSTVELSDGSLITVFYGHTAKDTPAVIMQQKWKMEF